MSRKPSFRVKLSSSQHENAPPQTSTVIFALPGTLAEEKMLRRSRNESRSKVQKTRLSDWNLNISDHDTSSSSLPYPSSTTTSIAYGMPTPLAQTPLDIFECTTDSELDHGAADNVIDDGDWMASGTSFPL
jgi:hypothetical protein